MPHDPNSLPSKIFGSIMIGVFGAVGITVLIFLWGTPQDSFGAPPLFFRVFGSLIAIAFIATSAMGLLGIWSGQQTRVQKMLRRGRSMHSKLQAPDAEAGPTTSSYGCPRCNAGLAADADISPSGDVKCTHCGNWFSTRSR